MCQIAVLVNSQIARLRTFGPNSKQDPGPKEHDANPTRDTEFLQTLFWTKNWAPLINVTCDTNLREFSTPEQGPNRWNGSLFSPIIETPSPAAPIGLFNLSGERLKYFINIFRT